MIKKLSGQLDLFSSINDNPTEVTNKELYSEDSIILTKELISKLNNYKMDDYIRDVETIGLKKTWDYICKYIIEVNKNPFLDINNHCELYEAGLAVKDKLLKKKSGQYYTPDDVARVMSEWLYQCDGDAVCDVACGTGKLILTYLDLIGYEKSVELISSGKLYLYDIDEVALKICRTAIAIKYGLDITDSINYISCDFLDKKIVLPDNCKVISNPPYSKLYELPECWEHTDVLTDTTEFYSAFMEKIFKQAKSTVIITPFSFINGSKFYSLRKEMCTLGIGFIISFDNVPGNIFHGKKHGVFNSNTSNSVRAAITVFHRNNLNKGFKISPLIRFKNEEREKLLKTKVLESTLPDTYQIVDKGNKAFKKINSELTDIFNSWVTKSDYILADFVSKVDTPYLIDTPNTCRYFTTASNRKLKRTGSITINIKDEKSFNFIYCLINSSFAYWWWRIYDGGITYPVSLFNSIPIPLNLLNEDDIEFFATTAKKLIANESRFIITKVNAGVAQENVKFPDEYREKINNRILSILGYNNLGNIFKTVHSNKFFEDK